jgi:Amino acid synthesis
MTVAVADAPRPDKIVLALALADRGRDNRCGDAPVPTTS